MSDETLVGSADLSASVKNPCLARRLLGLAPEPAAHFLHTQRLKALRKRFALSDDALMRLMAQAEQTAKTANDYLTLTSRMNDSFTQAQKIQMVESLWQVTCADRQPDATQNHRIREVAGLLHVTHGEYIAAKLSAGKTLSRSKFATFFVALGGYVAWASA